MISKLSVKNSIQYRISPILLIFFYLSFTGLIKATTLVSLTSEEKPYACVNEENDNKEANIWFSPGTEGSYGRITFGFTDGLTRSGMNEKGLFFAWSEIPRTSYTPSPERLMLTGEKIRGNCQMAEKVLQQCTVVSQAVEMIKEYNVPEFADHLLMLADAAGKSVVLEWAEGVLTIHEKKGNYMLATNYSLSSPGLGNYPCERYNSADRILEDPHEKGTELCKAVLKATYLTDKTVYSLICDIKTGIIHLFQDDSFEKTVQLNVLKELEHGTRSEKISSLMLGGIPTYDDLVKREGKMYYLDPSKPYTGKCIDYHTNGKKKMERDITGGIESGKRIKYFNDGKTEIVESYVDGEKNGHWESYRRDGTKKEEGEYTDSKPSGRWTGWYDENRKEYEKTYTDGKLDGKWTGWYENGNPEYEQNYTDGKLNGQYINWFDTGKMQSVKNYVDGTENGLHIEYYENGIKKMEKPVVDGVADGTEISYHENGMKEYEQQYDKGRETGIRTGWHSNGAKEYEVLYENGLKSGKYKSWHDNNQARCDGQYKKGKKEGQWTWYHPNGETDIIGSYEGGKETGTWQAWHSNKEMKFTRTYNSGIPTGKWEAWYPNTNKMFKGEYNNQGERDGKWQYWEESGNMLRQEIYEEGSLVKKTFYKEGKPYEPKQGEKMEGFYIAGEPVR
ncbi:MAG: linear amide C-N hydrolase [Bacteroidetes bacterium]|nr:linear amide C-N hydrolase [Bacteroidota bacterium]